MTREPVTYTVIAWFPVTVSADGIGVGVALCIWPLAATPFDPLDLDASTPDRGCELDVEAAPPTESDGPELCVASLKKNFDATIRLATIMVERKTVGMNRSRQEDNRAQTAP